MEYDNMIYNLQAACPNRRPTIIGTNDASDIPSIKYSRLGGLH